MGLLEIIIKLKYLLFGLEKYDAIYGSIRYLVGLNYDNYNYAKL